MNKTRLHYGWVVIFTSSLVAMASLGFARMSYTLILPAMKDGLTFSYTKLGVLETGNFVGYLIMAFLGGILASKFGSRIVIALALLLTGVAMILMGFSERFGFAFAMRFLTGLGSGAAYVPAMALGSAWFALNRRGLATGIIAAGIGGGILLSGLIVPIILNVYDQNGWRFAWYYLGGGVLLIAGMAALLIRNSPDGMGLRQVGIQETEDPELLAKPASGSLDWAMVYKMGALWYLGIVFSMFGFSYIIYMTFFVAYLGKEMGLTSIEAGRLYAMMGGLSILCAPVWGGLSDRIGRARSTALAYLVLSSSYAVFALWQTEQGFFLSAVLFGLTGVSVPTIMGAMAGDYVGPRLAPAAFGFITLFFGIGQALGPGLGGYLGDITGSFVGSFLLACGVSLLGAVLSLRLKGGPANK